MQRRTSWLRGTRSARTRRLPLVIERSKAKVTQLKLTIMTGIRTAHYLNTLPVFLNSSCVTHIAQFSKPTAAAVDRQPFPHVIVQSNASYAKRSEPQNRVCHCTWAAYG